MDWIRFVTASLLIAIHQCNRVGHANSVWQVVNVEGREPYRALLTRLRFSNLHCFQSLSIRSEEPLTGAEEIEIIYKPCKNDKIWRMVHYLNAAEKFVFQSTIFAKQLAVISRKDLKIIDFHLNCCSTGSGLINEYERICKLKNQNEGYVRRRANKVRESGQPKKQRSTKRRTRSTRNNDHKLFDQSNSPYHITEDLIVAHDKQLIIEPNVKLIFHNNSGIVVYGALFLNGRFDQPIALLNDESGKWRGIVIDQGAKLSANFCVIRYASIGLNLSSSNVILNHVQIQKPISLGILITDRIDDGQPINLGDCSISQSFGDGIRVIQTDKSITLRNVILEDCAENSINFIQPTADITLQNIFIENSGSYSVKLSNGNASDIHSVVISNLTIQKQERGLAGLFIRVQSDVSISMNTSNFNKNMVPSVLIEFTDEQKHRVGSNRTGECLVERNRFASNQNLVFKLIAHSGDLCTIRKNSFIANNNDGRHGALTLEHKPQMSTPMKMIIVDNAFIANAGQWSLRLIGTNDQRQSINQIQNNQFAANRNGQNSMIIDTPGARIDRNQFISHDDRLDLEIDFNSTSRSTNNDTILDATNNHWPMNSISFVKQPIMDGGRERQRGFAKVKPIGRKRAVDDCSFLSNCSNHGRCVGASQCECDPGFGGDDCGRFSCTKLRNCSTNGLCAGPNVCSCFSGWKYHDCSQPTCLMVNGCNGHGTCVSLNECDCQAGYYGTDCSMRQVNCTEDQRCGAHGICAALGDDPVCICANGWSGKDCTEPQCDQVRNCSSSGQCVGVQQCQCYPGFAGADCATCIDSTVCDLCNAQCMHGWCDTSTRECVCRAGWTGSDCSICVFGTCNVLSVVLYVMPTAIGIHQNDSNIYVHGNDLPLPPSRRYTCLFGSTASPGFYISSSLVRCSIPDNPQIGRYLFNIIPYGADKAVPFLDKRLIHFTFFDECNSNKCKGFCIGANCICPMNRYGNHCEQAKIVPKISHEILDNERLVKAIEGRPYSVKIPAQDDNAVYMVSSDANGLTINVNGVLTWTRPIGRERPYAINVTVSTAVGQSKISWNLSVSPSYTPIITSIHRVRPTNAKVIRGVVHYHRTNIGKVPVQVVTYCNGSISANVTVTTEADGQFQHMQFPTDQSSSGFAIAYHPGVTVSDEFVAPSNISWQEQSFDIDFAETLAVKPNDQISVDYQLKNNFAKKPLINCRIEVIAPRDKVQIIKYEKILKPIIVGQSSPMHVTYGIAGTIDNSTIIVQFGCADTPKHLIRHKLVVESSRSRLVSEPAELLITVNDKASPKIYTIDIIHDEEISYEELIRISINPVDSPLFYISTVPSLDEFESIGQLGSTITVALSHRSRTSSTINQTANSTFAGEITVSYRNEVLLSVPYRGIFTNQNYFDYHITVRDELSSLNPAHFVDDAVISFSNPMIGFEEHRQTSPQEPIVSFSITEGIYQLEVTSRTHQKVSLIVQPSIANSSLAIFAPLLPAYEPVVEDNEWKLEMINENDQNALLPMMQITPLLLAIPDDGTPVEVNLLLEDIGGSPDASVTLPSFSFANPQALPFQFHLPGLNNGMGLGDGYQLKSQLLRVNGTELRTTDPPCSVYALRVPFLFAAPQAFTNNAQESVVLIADTESATDQVSLCKVGLDSVARPVAAWTGTTIYCNCARRARERCRERYVSATSCGAGWNNIPDDTVSLYSLAMFIVLIADCRAAGVDLRLLKQSLMCASSLDSRCSSQRNQRSMVTPLSAGNSDQRRPFFEQFSLINDEMHDVIEKYFPAITTLDSQVNTAALYNDFFEQLQVVLPLKDFEAIAERQWFDDFFAAISDDSDVGMIVTADEFKQINVGNNTSSLVQRWNTTVADWTLSMTEPIDEPKQTSGIRFADARELMIRSDRLKMITRQHGAENPFKLLHDYMNNLLVPPSDESNDGAEAEEICAVAYTLVSPEKLHENDEFSILLKVNNKNAQVLDGVSVTLEMIRGHMDTADVQFKITELDVNGIGSIDGLSNFAANSSLSPVLILKFKSQSKQSTQRISAQTVFIKPRLSLKTYYFLSNVHVPAGLSQNSPTESPFSALIALMNTGYSELRDLVIEETRISVVPSNEEQVSEPFQIQNITINGQPIPSDTRIEIDRVAPGRVTNLFYNISAATDERVMKTGDLKVAVSVGGRMIALEDSKTFIVFEFIGTRKLLIAQQSTPQNLHLYNLHTSSLQNISPISLQNVSQSTDKSDERPFWRQLASFQLPNFEQSLTSSLYGKISFPKNLPMNWDILRMNRINTDGSLKLIDVHSLWTTVPDGEKMLNFVDEEVPEARSNTFTYELIYGNPEDFMRPHFEFPVYLVPLVDERWPHVGKQIALVTAISPSKSVIKYELYSDDDSQKYFSINADTGAVVLEKELPDTVDDNYCMTVVATDEVGRPESVTLTIAVDPERNDCQKLNDSEHRSPIVHVNPVVPVFGPATTSEIRQFTGDFGQIGLPPDGFTDWDQWNLQSTISESDRSETEFGPSISSSEPVGLSETSSLASTKSTPTVPSTVDESMSTSTSAHTHSEFWTQQPWKTWGSGYATTTATTTPTSAEFSSTNLESIVAVGANRWNGGSSTAEGTEVAASTTASVQIVDTDANSIVETDGWASRTAQSEQTSPHQMTETSASPPSVFLQSLSNGISYWQATSTPEASSTYSRNANGDEYQQKVRSDAELACRLKDTKAIWALICDLSKTAKSFVNFR